MRGQYAAMIKRPKRNEFAALAAPHQYRRQLFDRIADYCAANFIV
jgi:hypothetical protein